MRHLNNLKYMAMALFVAMLSLSFTACSDDDDDDGKTINIVGTWEVDGSTDAYFTRMTFKADGTGIRVTQQGSLNFKYTMSYDSSTGTGKLKYWYLDDDTVYNETITITGNTMMMTSGGSTSVWKKI